MKMIKRTPPVEEESYLKIVPESVELPAKHGIMFEFRAIS